MPLRFEDGKYVLRCINEHPVVVPEGTTPHWPQGGVPALGPSTMQRAQGWRGLVAVHPPPKEGEPFKRQIDAAVLSKLAAEGGGPFTAQEFARRVRAMPQFDATSGTPVAVYVCSVCGYVEMYHAPNVEPEVWR